MIFLLGSRTSDKEKRANGHEAVEPSPRGPSRQMSANGERPPTRAESTKSGESGGGEEYHKAFASRPKVPRTPDPSAVSPTSMQALPVPKFSGNEPKQRPGSGNANRHGYANNGK